jgi:hypothetical protein
VVHIALCPIFLARWNLPGLAAATSVSAVVNYVGLQILFRRNVGALGWGSILWQVGQWLPGLIGIWLIVEFAPDVMMAFPEVISLFLTIGLAAGFYFGYARLAGFEEARVLLRFRARHR